jgi:D-alanyl-D-alanine carboxypeptidase
MLSFFSYYFIGENMKKIITFLLILVVPFKINALEVGGTSAILLEQSTNKILYAKNIHDQRSVASISKIMTAILAVDSGKMSNMVSIGDEIDKSYGSAVYIKKGEKMLLEDLVYGLMLRSGNDAAYAIASYVGKDVENFITMMNDKAKELGMRNTVFNNPHGLDEGEMKGNFSTAYDMAILTSYANKNKLYKKITGTKKHKVSTNKNSYSWTNKNKLLNSYKYTTGGKTGFTTIARRTLVTTASKGNLDLIVVTLNNGNDFGDHKSMFEYGFDTYKSYKILKKGIINIYDDTYYKDYNLYIKRDFVYPLLEEEKGNIVLKFEIERERKYKRNDNIGKVIVTLNSEIIKEEPIYIKGLKTTKKSFLNKIKSWIKNDK